MPKIVPLIDVKIRRLNSKGWSDSKIARYLGIGKTCVGVHRRRLGLPVVPRRQEESDKMQRVESRYAGWEEEAIKAGWPGVTPAQRRILEALETLGGQGTIRQVNEINGTHYEHTHSPAWFGLIVFGWIFEAGRLKVRGRAKIYRIAEYVMTRRLDVCRSSQT